MWQDQVSNPAPLTYELGALSTALRGSAIKLALHWIGWSVGCLGLNGPLRQYFSLYRAVSQREGERKEK